VIMIYFHHHDDTFLVTPSLVIQATQCDNPECQARHWSLLLGWFVWSCEIVFGD